MTDTPVSLLGFEYQALIDDISKKSIGFQTTIPKDCSQHDLNALLDKCREAADRQRVFAKIDALKTNLMLYQDQADSTQIEISKQDKAYAKRAEEHGGRAERGLSASEIKDRQAKIAAFEGTLKSLESTRQMIAVLEKSVHSSRNDVQPSSQTNGEQARWADNGGASPAE